VNPRTSYVADAARDARRPEEDRSVILRVQGVCRGFGGLVALEDVDLDVQRAAVCSIIGPNGAGKTTLFNLLSGGDRPDAGSIVFDGREIAGARPDRITRWGIARTFQNIRLLRSMTALENVLVGAHGRLHAGLLRCIVKTPAVRREEREVRVEARALLEFVGIGAAAIGRPATELSYGDQRRVEIARALASHPALLLLDEPCAGMNHGETAGMVTLVRRLQRERGVTVLLIEHDMRLVKDLSEHVTVLDQGRKISEGPPEAVLRDQAVIDAYLGQAPE
jgi:branched-chain amino acid transport system ATP-binding protein